MPDARTVGENGVAVYQTMNSTLGAFYRPVFDDDGCPRAPQSHVAFPKDEAEALLGVAESYRSLQSQLGQVFFRQLSYQAQDAIRSADGALARIDAARKQGGSDE